MQDTINTFAEPLAGLSKGDWLRKLAAIADEHGYFQPLGNKHFAAFVEDGETLLVTFETIQAIRGMDEDAQPLGWEMVKALGWSHLALVSDGDTWFRDDKVFGYFDRLVDDGFFDEFDRVIFYGAGPCAYAAAAFSVTAPGATVIAVQPQATLNPDKAGWDDRFDEQRRLDFTSRYGFAPDMLEAAEQGFVIYDPLVLFDAMHAALFHGPNITRLPMRHAGAALQPVLMDTNLLFRLFAQAGGGKLNRESFATLWRARREYPPYLRSVLSAAEARETPHLAKALCRNVTSRMKAPKFARRLKELESSGD